MSNHLSFACFFVATFVSSLIEIPPNSSFFCTEKRSTIDQTKEFKEIFICAWYCVFFP